jgi:glutamyl-Q tRNA(Asp) synthetase
MACRGRFAPSPTGLLHFGSLIAAMASRAQALSQGGEWLVRMEDLDRSREVPGAGRNLLKTLRVLGLNWDGAVVYQSERTEAYEAALSKLESQGLLYPCSCTRSEIAAAGRWGAEGPVYPGTCRSGLRPGRISRTLRLRTAPGAIHFADLIQGEQCQDVSQAVGDFVLRRADGIHAYQLAVVVDDAWQGIEQVVRGADLLLSTPRQILLQRALGLPSPVYAHIPLALDAAGRKLSKSLASMPVDHSDPLPALRRAWDWLGQAPAPTRCSIAGFWTHAIAHWQIERIPACRAAPADRTPPTEEDISTI